MIPRSSTTSTGRDGRRIPSCGLLSTRRARSTRALATSSRSRTNASSVTPSSTRGCSASRSSIPSRSGRSIIPIRRGPSPVPKSAGKSFGARKKDEAHACCEDDAYLRSGRRSPLSGRSGCLRPGLSRRDQLRERRPFGRRMAVLRRERHGIFPAGRSPSVDHRDGEHGQYDQSDRDRGGQFCDRRDGQRRQCRRTASRDQADRTLDGTPPYSLMVLPSITSWQQLKGKTISLATKQEITAIAFRMMAKAHHLDWNNDFSITLAGSTPARYAALQSGNVQGAMLGQPFNFTAEAQGMRTLDEAYNYMKVWMFDGIVVNPTWAAAHRQTVVKFIRALRKGTEYAYTHRDDAIRILANETHSDRAIVEKAYDLDFGKWHAYARDAQLDPKKVQGVIDGVVAQGVLPAPIPLSDLIDTSYGREALR